MRDWNLFLSGFDVEGRIGVKKRQSLKTVGYGRNSAFQVCEPHPPPPLPWIRN